MKNRYIIIILFFCLISYGQNSNVIKESIYFDVNCKSDVLFFKIKKEKKLYRISFHVNGDSIVFLSQKKKFTKKEDKTKTICCDEISKLSIKHYINIMENKKVYIFKNRRMFYLVQEMVVYEKNQE